MQLSADHSVDNIIMDNHFLGKTNETYERYVFNSRRQEAHETVDDYISALCTLASTCNFCDCLKDSLLRDRIVLGIKDSSTRKRLLQEADLNLETCIAMCRAAQATSPPQPVKTETWTEDTTAVQAGSVSSGDQRPGKKQDLSLSLRHCDPMAFPDEAEMSEVNIKTELDDSDDDYELHWTTEHQSSGVPRDRTEHNEPAWSMEEDSADQPSAVYSTVQPMSDNTSGSLLSLKRGRVCQHCSAAFVLVSSLELHLASVHGEKLHMVLPGSSTPDRCDAGNCSSTDIHKEVDSHGDRKITKRKDDNNYAGDKDGKKMRKQHVCDVCRKTFTKPSELERHKLIHSGVKAFVCDICGQCFTLACNLKTHKLSHSNHKAFVCDVCCKKFTRAFHLTRHKKIHTGERPYKCPHCDNGFKRSSHLQTHIKSVHEGVRPHVCDVCGAAFSDIGQLAVHRRIHTGEKPHVCSDCGKGFARSGNLAQHQLTHTGEKPHVCPDCGKGFACAKNLKRHCLFHIGEKPHVCSDCGKGFTLAHDLAQHRLTHTGVKPHVCSDCGKGFTLAHHLAGHRLTHTGQKPHSCPHCPAAFKYSYQLKAHIESEHQ